ncbi:hypothetical protein DL770_007731 [Monosporascus sp. CRB-9-2]|nr:hypothetical protein DL770_007731 [Monosporascus sp. CRB-9-2]
MFSITKAPAVERFRSVATTGRYQVAPDYIAVSYKLSQKRALFVSINLEAITLLEPVAEGTHLADEELARHQHGIENAPTTAVVPTAQTASAQKVPIARRRWRTWASRVSNTLSRDRIHSSSQPEARASRAAARMVHSAHDADEASSGCGRAGYEWRLEPVRRNVADEWHVRVRPSRARAIAPAAPVSVSNQKGPASSGKSQRRRCGKGKDGRRKSRDVDCQMRAISTASLERAFPLLKLTFPNYF